MLFEPETWVAVAFVILMGLFAYLGHPPHGADGARQARRTHQAELDDARRLKEEAAKLLADYKSKRTSAEREAEEIHRQRQGRSRAHRVRSQGQDGRLRRPSHQDRRGQDRARRVAGAGGRSCRCGHRRRHRRSTILSQSVKGSVADDLLTKGIAEVRAKLN